MGSIPRACRSLFGALEYACSQECPLVFQARFASKKAGGSTKNRKGSNAQRLGVKLFHGQECKPGSIIIRQRGTKWRPGDNVGLGKDHTIYAMTHGWVNFFSHPVNKRTYVGVLSKENV